MIRDLGELEFFLKEDVCRLVGVFVGKLLVKLWGFLIVLGVLVFFVIEFVLLDVIELYLGVVGELFFFVGEGFLFVVELIFLVGEFFFWEGEVFCVNLDFVGEVFLVLVLFIEGEGD